MWGNFLMQMQDAFGTISFDSVNRGQKCWLRLDTSFLRQPLDRGNFLRLLKLGGAGHHLAGDLLGQGEALGKGDRVLGLDLCRDQSLVFSDVHDRNG